MTNINFNPRTTPIALVGIGGAIIIMLIYANAFGHLDAIFTIIFGIVGVCALIGGAYLYVWATNSARPWNFS